MIGLSGAELIFLLFALIMVFVVCGAVVAAIV